MKKFLRPLLMGVAVVATLLIMVLVLAFQSSVQTWAARRALGGQADIKGGIGRVSAGLKLIELTDIKIEKPGFALTEARTNEVEALYNHTVALASLRKAMGVADAFAPTS